MKVIKKAKQRSPLKPKFPKIQIDKNKDVLMCWTDGACEGNGKEKNIGGYGFLIVENDKVLHQYTRRVDNTTNNKMELQGIIDCLEYIEENRIYEPQIILHSDSQYCIHGICSWRHGWIKRDWKDVKNVEQWKHLSNLVNILTNVQFKWVRAHQTDDSIETKYNCIIDEAIQKCMFGEKRPDTYGKARMHNSPTMDRFMSRSNPERREKVYQEMIVGEGLKLQEAPIDAISIMIGTIQEENRYMRELLMLTHLKWDCDANDMVVPVIKERIRLFLMENKTTEQ